MANKSIKKGNKRKYGRGENPKSKVNLISHPGRPKGVKNHDGLQAVLNMFKDLISKESNLKKLEKAMQLAFDKQPLYFYSKYVMPILPRDIKLDTPGDLIFQISKSYRPKIKGKGK